MRFTLPESSHRRQRSPGGTLVSVALHAVVIGGTLVATGMSAERPRPATPPAETLIYVVEPPTARPTARPSLPPPRRAVTPDPTITPPALPTPLVVSDPTIVPTSLPAVDQPLGAPFDSTVRAATGVASGDSLASSQGSGDPGAALSAFAVDREVVAIRGVAPRYPSLLANAGVEGTVVLQFVVDTLGRVEPRSLEVVRADQPLFVQSVREALTRTRFVPAEAAGRKVRQLVEQAFTFNLARR
ncbi:MAG TPA: TonB family protein [Gemmatimonadaceae bacterium]|jgi:protein TonB|nr:TonB family protein [Gemmatimonadaceae bacterium]